MMMIACTEDAQERQHKFENNFVHFNLTETVVKTTHSPCYDYFFLKQYY